MSLPRRTRLVVASIGATSALVVTGAGMAVAAYSGVSGSGTILACWKNLPGTIRIVDHFPCKTGETAISWNQKGVKGDPGARGSTGAAGPAGSAGAKGDTGAAGAKGDTGAGGAKGDTGATGDPGPVGPPGADGGAGAAAFIGSVGTAFSDRGNQYFCGTPSGQVERASDCTDLDGNLDWSNEAPAGLVPYSGQIRDFQVRLKSPAPFPVAYSLRITNLDDGSAGDVISCEVAAGTTACIPPNFPDDVVVGVVTQGQRISMLVGGSSLSPEYVLADYSYTLGAAPAA
jgi:hypothetical protein